MSLKADIEALKALLEPKPDIRFVFDENEVKEVPGVVWVIFTLSV